MPSSKLQLNRLYLHDWGWRDGVMTYVPYTGSFEKLQKNYLFSIEEMEVLH